MPDPRRRGLLVVFEGIDGSGKTTLSGRVAAALRGLDLVVTHVRPDGRLVSDTAEAIRGFARDPRQLGLTPIPELLLYLARESQQLEEAVVPALARADVVIADRCVHSAEVLAGDGRGLGGDDVAAAVRLAGQRVTPDLIVLIDVDPEVALARRRADRELRPERRPDSRKDLSGAGLLYRMRAGYLRLAAAAPERWLVVDNSAASLPALTAALAGRIQATLLGPQPPERRAREAGPESMDATPPAAAAPPRDPADALRALLDWIDAAGEREPEVAAALLRGLAGEPFDGRRRALAASQPVLIAAGLRGLTDPASWELRERLAGPAPAAVARSLRGLRDRRADELRQRLWPLVPAAVVESLAGDASTAAWALRERWISDQGERVVAEPVCARVACGSIAGLDDARAWQLRGLTRAASPAAALQSLAGLSSDRAWLWRDRHVARAPGPVLRTLAGLAEPRAWAMRAHHADSAAEAIDSLVSSDDPRAWELRGGAVDRWPTAVAGSLGPLAGGERGRALLGRLLECHGSQLGVLRHAAAAATLVAMAACGGGGGASDSGLGDPVVLAGTFEVELVAADEPYTSMLGTVYDGGSPSAVIWEQADGEGPCVLLTPRVPFCSTPCGGTAVCVEDETCQEYPAAQDVGTVAVSGVRTMGGGDAFDMRLVAGNYQLPAGVSLEYPPFAEGDEVRIELDGGALTGPFTLEASGIAPLVLVSQDLALERDTVLALSWEPPGAAADTQMLVKLDISHHGGTRGKIECTAPDSGSLELGAGLITQLLDLGASGFPTIILGRTAIGTAVIASGRVELHIASELEVAVDVPGVVSCTDTNQCPEGQTCQDDLTCG